MPFVVAWAIFATYVLAARGVRNLFPISVFDMYQAHAPEYVARVLVVDAHGATAEVDAFDDWTCEWEVERLDRLEPVCGSRHRPIEYVTRDQTHWIERHAAETPGPETVTLVSRAYRLRPEAGAPPHEDCAVARCTVRRRDAP